MRPFFRPLNNLKLSCDFLFPPLPPELSLKSQKVFMFPPLAPLSGPSSHIWIIILAYAVGSDGPAS